ncbi:MAG: DNA topoisomerase IV subunit A [Nitrospinota bacterium]|nr:DNA topoisomerase IV subunit A [Nitrospinota bacterium]
MAKEKESDINHELENRFLTYALSTIVSRSLPDVRDGLKPIHRRILYAINSMGVTSDAKPVKSAKIIGEVLGKYHPHGDASTYESMVRMAQDFSMRYPLVDGKGNFGSLDGDPPAAYRYTEGRLTPITSYILNDIKKDTVDFRMNYDNTLKEPEILPSRIPNLLINGSSGIAVGMACSFPSHNLTEVISALISLVDDPNQTTAQIMKSIKGPDFATGGIILNSKTELRQAYDQGMGAVKMRGEWESEDLSRGKKQIILTAIPYGVNKSRLIEKIAEIIMSKKLLALTDIRDESDEKVRVVLEIKTGTDPEMIMTYLFKHTELESNFQLNFNCLKPTGEPARLSLKEICTHFLDFRKDVIVRRLKFDLAVLEKRLHILAGFVIIFQNLDQALKLIRSSKSRQEASTKLKQEFRLDDEQVTAVLEIPLYRLVSMEIDKIKLEQNEKLKEQNEIKSILASQKKIWGVVKTELKEIDDKFGDKRRTKIKTIETVEYNAEDFIEHEDVVLVLSRNGWLRKIKTLNDPATLKYKEKDGLLGIVRTNTRDLVAIFTSAGMVYIHKVFNLPYTRGGFGEPVQSLFKFGDGERVIKILSLPGTETEAAKTEDTGEQHAFDFEDSVKNSEELLFVNDAGNGFRFPVANLTETTRAGKRVMSIKKDARMVAVSPVTGSYVFLVSEAGKGLLIELEQVTQLSGAGLGVKLMNPAKSKVSAARCMDRKATIQMIFEEGKSKELNLSKITPQNRGGQGVFVAKDKKIINLI